MVSPYFVLVGQTPAVCLHPAVLLLHVGFDLLVLSPLLLSPGHHAVCGRPERHMTTKRLNDAVPLKQEVKPPFNLKKHLESSITLMIMLRLKMIPLERATTKSETAITNFFEGI